MKLPFKGPLVIVTFSVAMVAAIGIPNFVRARSAKASNACVNNLRQLQAAIEQWSLEYAAKTNATVRWEDIVPYLKQTPHCPDGGTYILTTVSEPPKCSIGGIDHKLPQ